jgi:cyclopropane-fatty-acyl-phospholipid synthase
MRSVWCYALGQLQRRLGGDPPRFRLVLPDGEAFDLAPAPAVTIHFRSVRVLRYLLTGDMRRLGDAYTARDLEVDGSVEEILRQGLVLASRIGRSPIASRLMGLLAVIRKRHTRARDAAAILYHYDISNEFYCLWLTP